MKKLYWFLILFVFASSACEWSDIDNQLKERGSLVSYTVLMRMTPEMLNQALFMAGVESGPELKYSFDIVTVVYRTLDVKGEIVEASGAIFIPVSTGSFPVLSFQHGTQTKRSEVASEKNIYTLEGIAGAVSASMGFVASVPDYLGLGKSTMLHPYLHSGLSASCVIDMIKATKNYCEQQSVSLTDQLFLSGYSEGGYVTLATQKDLEQNYAAEFTITASAPMAGPYDLQGTVDNIFSQGQYDIPGNAAYLAMAYNSVYEMLEVDEIFEEPYASRVTSLFDGSKTISEINPQLTTSLSLLFTETFLTNYVANRNSVLRATLEANTLINWQPKSKTRFYHGDADNVVPYQNTVTAYERFTQNGERNIEMVTIEGGTHETSAIPSVVDMLFWFDDLKAGK